MEKYFKLKDGTEIFLREDLVEEPVANLIINHGFAEHCDRYDHVAKAFNERNISVYRYDLRGHGRTRTKKGHIDSYWQFIDDLDQLVDYILAKEDKLPLFMLGHSMGGFISCIYGIDHGNKLRGQILSGPAVIRANEAKGIKGKLLLILAKLMPNKKIKNVLTDDVCSDREVVEDYLKDPMVLSHATANFLKEFQLSGIEYIEENISKYECPCFINHGEDDRVISKDASLFLYENISSKDKEIKIYDDLYHEILNEEIGLEIVENMAKWIYDRVDNL